MWQIILYLAISSVCVYVGETRTLENNCRNTCSKIWDPVCATNGQTYVNLCHLERAILCLKERTRYFKQGECKEACSRVCPQELFQEPICASNGIEYNSECEMKAAIECQNLVIKKLHNGKCTDREKICTMPKDSETCITPTYSRKYYFNAYRGICEPFLSRGCYGNKNSFNSEKECMGYCYTDVCTLPKNMGTCTSYDPRFFFNQFTGTCDVFGYRGCHGNANNFHSERLCKSSCDRCTLLPAAGDGYADAIRYYFNPDTRKCETFTYNGINGNANRFLTEGQCNSTCVNILDDDDDIAIDDDFMDDNDANDAVLDDGYVDKSANNVIIDDGYVGKDVLDDIYLNNRDDDEYEDNDDNEAE